MISFLGCSAQGIAVASGVTTVALLERLVEQKVLTRADVGAILGSGIQCLEPRTNVPTIAEAVHLMRDRSCRGASARARPLLGRDATRCRL
jgi:hypothetical protein